MDELAQDFAGLFSRPTSSCPQWRLRRRPLRQLPSSPCHGSGCVLFGGVDCSRGFQGTNRRGPEACKASGVQHAQNAQITCSLLARWWLRVNNCKKPLDITRTSRSRKSTAGTSSSSGLGWNHSLAAVPQTFQAQRPTSGHESFFRSSLT